MAAGRFNRRMKLMRASNGSRGATTKAVSPVFTFLDYRWAEILSTGGREFLAAQAVNDMVMQIIKLRYDSLTASLTARDQLEYRGRVFNIGAAYNEHEQNKVIVCWCVE